MEIEVRIDGITRTVDVQRRGDDGWLVCVDGGDPVEVTGGALSAGEWALTWAGARRRAGVHVSGDRVDLQLHGRAWSAQAVDARKAALQLGGGGSEGVVITQMPGIVVRLLVAVGDQVQVGQPVIVVEAMKMENEFKSAVAGLVSALHVQPGQAVESGTALVTVDPVG